MVGSHAGSTRDRTTRPASPPRVKQSKRPEIKSLWIDIGASSRTEAESAVRLGDPISFQQDFQALAGERAAARGFDNKAGVFIAAEALRLLRDGGDLHNGVGVYAVATVQEEIGSRGVQTAAFGINAATGLAVDMDHAIDYPGANPSQNGDLQIGKGPTVSRGPNINHTVFDLVTEAARDEGIPYQVSVFAKATPTDAGAMQINRSGMATGLLGVPIRYMHTPSETLSLRDVEDCARLVAAYCPARNAGDRLHARALGGGGPPPLRGRWSAVDPASAISYALRSPTAAGR